MKILICGGDDFSKMVMNPDGNGVDHNHPTFYEKQNEYDFIRGWIQQYLCPQSYGDEANFTWQPPNDLTIVCVKDQNNGVARSASDWAIVNWSDFYEYSNFDDLYDNCIPDAIVRFPGESDHIKGVEEFAQSCQIGILEVGYVPKK